MASPNIRPALIVNQKNCDHDVQSNDRDTTANVNATSKSNNEKNIKSGRSIRTTRIPISKNNRSPISNMLLNYSGDSGIGTTKLNESSYRSRPTYDVRRIPVKLREIKDTSKSKPSHIPLCKFGDQTVKSDTKSEGHTEKDNVDNTPDDRSVHRMQVLNCITDFETHTPASSIRSYPRSQATRFSVDTDDTSGKNIDVASEEPMELISAMTSSDKVTAVYDSIMAATNKIKAVNESVSKWLNNEFKICTYKEPRISSNCRYCSLTEKSQSYDNPIYHLNENVGICLENNERETKETRYNEVRYDFPKRNFNDIPNVRHRSKSNAAVKPSDHTLTLNTKYATNATYMALEVNNDSLGVNKDFQYPSKKTLEQMQAHVPSYTVCPSEVLQKTTNFECSESLTNTTHITDLDHDNFSSQFTIEHPDEYAILDAWCPHSNTSLSNVGFKKCTKCSKDKSGPWARRENNEGFSDETTKDYSDGTTKDSGQSNNATSLDFRSGDDTCMHYPATHSGKERIKKLDRCWFPSKKYNLNCQFRLFRRHRSGTQQPQRQWIHVWKKKTKWSNWSRAPFKFRKFRMLHSVQRSVIWEDVDVQTNILVFRETGTTMALQQLRSAAIATSASFGFLKNTVDKDKKSSFRLRSPFKHINLGPSRFPFNHTTSAKMKSASVPKPSTKKESKKETTSIRSEMCKNLKCFDTNPRLSYKCYLQEEKGSVHKTFSSEEINTSAIFIQPSCHEKLGKVFHDTSTEPIAIESTDVKLFPPSSAENLSIAISQDSLNCAVDTGQKDHTYSNDELEVRPETVIVKTISMGVSPDHQKSEADHVPLSHKDSPKNAVVLSTSQSSLVDSIYQPFVFEVGTMSSIHEQKSFGVVTAKDETFNKSVMNLDLQPEIISATTSTRLLTNTTSTGHSAMEIKNTTFDVHVQYSDHKCFGVTNSREIQTDREIKSAAVLTSCIALDKATDPDNCDGPQKDQLATLVRLIGKPRENPTNERSLVSSAPMLSSIDANKWMKWCPPCCPKVTDYDSYVDSKEDSPEIYKLFSQRTTKNPTTCDQVEREIFNYDAPLPFENLSKDSLAEDVAATKNLKKSYVPEHSVYHLEQSDNMDKVDPDVKTVKELKESVLQTRPEFRDAGTLPICNRRSAGVLTSQRLLPKCYHYPDINPMDCILIHGPPGCTVHAMTHEPSIWKCCMHDTSHKRKRTDDVSVHSIGLLTSCFGLPQRPHETQALDNDIIGDVLPPKLYKSLYELAKLIEKESNLSTDNGTKTFGFISAGDDVIVRDNRSQSTVTAGHGVPKYPSSGQGVPTELARNCSNNYRAGLYVPPYNDQDSNEDHLKKSTIDSCRYYSHLLSKQFMRVKENLKHLRATDEHVYRLSDMRYKTACTMIPSGRVELCCQTTKRQKSTTPLSRCVMAPSVTNIGDGQDKKHLKNIYYMLTAIEGRIRRLRHNIQN